MEEQQEQKVDPNFQKKLQVVTLANQIFQTMVTQEHCSKLSEEQIVERSFKLANAFDTKAHEFMK